MLLVLALGLPGCSDAWDAVKKAYYSARESSIREHDDRRRADEAEEDRRADERDRGFDF